MNAVLTQPGYEVSWMPGAGPSDVAGDFYLDLPGGASKAGTTDKASLDVTQELDLRAEITPVTWAHGVTDQAATIASKFVVSGNQRSWWFYLLSDGQLGFQWSTNGTGTFGTTLFSRQSFARVPFHSGRLWVRAVLLGNNGSGGNTTFFYTSADGAVWTEIRSEVAAGTTSIHAGTAPLDIGSVSGFTTSLFVGRVHRFEQRSLLNGPVIANPDFTAQPPGTTSFADTATTPNTWTVTSPGSVAGFDFETIPADRVKSLEIKEGRDNELDVFSPSTCTLVLRNNDRRYDPEHTTGPHFGDLLPRVPFRVRFRAPATVLRLPGVAGATASTPDHSSFAVTDLDVRVHLSMDDWTPGGFGQFICGQWPNVAGNNGWVLAVRTTGELDLNFTTNGTTTLTRTSTVATGFADGSDRWLRVTLDANDGSGNHDVTFYTSTDGVIWSQLGAVVPTAGTVALFNSTAPLAVGDILPLAGQVRSVEVRSGIEATGSTSTVVANPDFSEQIPGATSFTDSTGRVWTVNGTASIGFGHDRWYDWFHGFVRGGWRQGYRKALVSTCTLDLADRLGVIEDEPVPQSAYDAEVLAGKPRAFWKLDESEGVMMADSSGNGFHGTRDNGEAVDPLVFGDGHGFFAPHVGDNRGIFKGEGLPEAPPCTIVAWCKTPRDLVAAKVLVNVQRDNARGSALILQIGPAADSPNGQLVINFFGLGTAYKARGSTPLDDDRPHMVTAVIGSTTAADILLYVDGQVETKTTISGTNGGNWTGHLWWTVANTADITGGDFGLDGVADEVSVYDRVLSADEIAELYAAGTTAFGDELSGTRVDRVLDLLAVPESVRDIAAGDSPVGPAAYNGDRAGPYAQKVVEAEQGTLFVDHRGGGKLKFRGRYARLTEHRSTTSRATFTPSHFREDLVPEPNGIDTIVNVVDVTWRGGKETVTDDTSRRAFGPQSRSLTTEAATPAAAQSSGNWMIARYKNPQTRLRHLPLNLGGKPELWPTILGLRTSDRVTVRRHPQKVGAAVDNQLIIEGTSLALHEDKSWTVDYQLSNADDTDVWIWGTATWGETTIWG